MAIFKSYNTLTPNLGLSDNVKVGRLWGIAGRLDGMLVTEATPLSGGIVNIRLSPGAFLHAGIVVTSDTYIDIGTFSPPSPVVLPPIFFSGTFPVNESVYLVAQSNGPDESALPTFSLLTATQFNAVQDANNFAAILDIYDKRILGNAFEATVPFDGATGGWTLIGPGTKVTALNGTGSGLLSGANTNSDLWALAPLPSIQALDVRFMSLSFFCLSDVATATIATGTVTLGGAVTPGDRLSIFINGFETAHVATGIDTPSTIATALRANLLTNPDVDYLLDPGATTAVGPVITLVTIVKGRQAKFDLATVASPLATTTIVNVPMVGGSQASFVVDFPIATGGVTTIAPVTVYPPPGVGFVQVDVPVDLGDMLVATFNNLNLRAVVTAAGGGFVRVGRVTVLVSYRETNLGIDVAPPSNLAHWRPGASVAVGSGASTSALGVHRLLNPIDHPDRSITRQKIRIGAVGPQEISPRTVGFNFTEKFHTATDLADPPAGTGVWTIIDSDLNLEEISDIVKRLALQGFNSGGSFAIDHDAASGHHRSAKYSEFLSGVNGMLLKAFTVLGDINLDRDAGATDKHQTISQFFLSGALGTAAPGIAAKQIALIGGTAGAIVVGSKGQADDAAVPSLANRDIGFMVSTEGGQANPKKRFFSLALNPENTKDFYGAKTLNGYPVSGLQSARTSLFSAGVGFMQTVGTPAIPFTGRSTDATNHHVYSDISFLGTSDASGNYTGSPPASFNTNPNGCAVYETRTGLASTDTIALFNPDRGFWFSNITQDAAVNTTWLYLPFPVKDVFDRVTVRVNVHLFMTWFQGVIGGFSSIGGLSCYPAYDAFDVIAATGGSVSIVTPSPLTTTYVTDFPMKQTTGIIRRQPWVLTPSGYRHCVGIDPGAPTPPNGAYYNPGNFFVGTPDNRATTLTSGGAHPGQAPSGSIIERTPMPYYDKRAASGPNSTVGGIFIKTDQGRADQRVVTQIDQFTSGGRAMSRDLEIELSIPLKSSPSTFITLPGGGGRTPDGIAICMNPFDRGISIQSPPASSGIFSAIAFQMSGAQIEIEGIVDGIEKKTLTSLV